MGTEYPESERHVKEVVIEFDERLGLRASNERYASLVKQGNSKPGIRVILDDFSDIPA